MGKWVATLCKVTVGQQFCARVGKEEENKKTNLKMHSLNEEWSP